MGFPGSTPPRVGVKKGSVLIGLARPSEVGSRSGVLFRGPGRGVCIQGPPRPLIPDPPSWVNSEVRARGKNGLGIKTYEFFLRPAGHRRSSRRRVSRRRTSRRPWSSFRESGFTGGERGGALCSAPSRRSRTSRMLRWHSGWKGSGRIASTCKQRTPTPCGSTSTKPLYGSPSGPGARTSAERG
jgi:hypothetical protein